MADTLPTEQRGNSWKSEAEKDAPTHLDLFSGVGGFALAAQWAGFRTMGFCEIDKYCQKVLAKNFLADADGIRFDTGRTEQSLQRIGESSEAQPQIFGNIFDLDGRDFYGIDLITGGFPCQPFSVAGKRRGAADDRAIWPQMFRIINEARPAWVLGENVPGIISMELDNVLSDLEGIGYATRAFVIPACALDARHRRDRLWIVGRLVGNATSERCQRNRPGGEQVSAEPSQTRIAALRTSKAIPDSSGRRLSLPELEPGESERRLGAISAERTLTTDYCRWSTEPDVGRVAHGIPNRVDRLKGLGNAIVPQVAYEILKEIRKLI